MWKDILKAGCMSKMGDCSCKDCMKQQFEKAGEKPDFLDLDKDGNTTEPMKDAAKKAKCPHCDGNAPKSECICGQMNKQEEKMGRPDGQCNICGQMFFADPRGLKESKHMKERHGQ